MTAQIAAYGRLVADALAKHTKGDVVSIGGTMQVNQWTGQDGNTQSGYSVIADSVISARTSRPGGGRTKQQPAGNTPPAQTGAPQAATPQEGDPFPDDIPF